MAWALAIFSLSSIPSLASGLPGNTDLILRKLAHAGEYAVLTVLLYCAFRSGHAMSRTRALIFACIIALVYAASDEFHQLFVPGREGRLRDIAIDAVGIVLAASFFFFRIRNQDSAIKRS